MKKTFIIAAMVMLSMTAANAAGTEDRNNVKIVSAMQAQSGDIYGTWKATVDNGTENVTVTISQNAMTITKEEQNGDKETKVFDSFKYNAKTNKIKAHQCKEININGGVQRMENDRDTETYYVTWIDNNHIQLGDHPGDYEDDFGTLVRQ